MRRLLATFTAILALAGAGLSLAAPSNAAPVPGSSALSAVPAGSSVQVHAGTSDAAGTPSPTGTSSPSATPSEPPANPGTGEPAESETNRLEYAPYVIAAVLIITLLVVFIWRRRRGNKTVV
ncbi:cobalamin biosynthesis Mg chelatase CobN [Arthrobacter globiformis]|uniref:LuxR family transcriptional regulator n=1 Tax=Arthrobacter globiformis TaxID=1665 RepID=UPI0027831617|nr:LuxR family transcriptional regulator [Arthrobacter globiformis]MDQ1060011.1 cobalamin biosynthesis Mg chelatase CobN [Arthrobacter globiformis]